MKTNEGKDQRNNDEDDTASDENERRFLAKQEGDWGTDGGNHVSPKDE